MEGRPRAGGKVPPPAVKNPTVEAKTGLEKSGNALAGKGVLLDSKELSTLLDAWRLALEKAISVINTLPKNTVSQFVSGAPLDVDSVSKRLATTMHLIRGNLSTADAAKVEEWRKILILGDPQNKDPRLKSSISQQINQLREAEIKSFGSSTVRGEAHDLFVLILSKLSSITNKVISQLPAQKGKPVAPVAVGSAPANLPTNIVVFGDSLSDQGNLLAWISQLRPVVPKMPIAPYHEGRFSNGDVWPGYLKRVLGLSILNHSYGGASATTSKDEIFDVFGRVVSHVKPFITGTLAGQISTWAKSDRLKQNPKDSIFIIWIGANDFFDRMMSTANIEFLLDAPLKGNRAAGFGVISESASAEVAKQIRELYNFGARRILLINLPDLGITPQVEIVRPGSAAALYHPADTSHAKSKQLSSKMTQMVQKYNSDLETVAHNLQGELSKKDPSFKLQLLDAFSAINRVIGSSIAKTPDTNGVYEGMGIDPTLFKSEIQGSSVLKPCYVGGYTEKNPPASCPNADKAPFFDITGHPSKRTHCWIAYLVHGALYNAGFIGTRAPVLKTYATICNGA